MGIQLRDPEQPVGTFGRRAAMAGDRARRHFGEGADPRRADASASTRRRSCRS